MIHHLELNDREVRKLIRKSIIRSAGNERLKIVGTLSCPSGKKMKKSNRVFFNSMEEAIRQGFRPCGQCMNPEYKKWKNEFVQRR